MIADVKKEMSGTAVRENGGRGVAHRESIARSPAVAPYRYRCHVWCRAHGRITQAQCTSSSSHGRAPTGVKAEVENGVQASRGTAANGARASHASGARASLASGAAASPVGVEGPHPHEGAVVVTASASRQGREGSSCSSNTTSVSVQRAVSTTTTMITTLTSKMLVAPRRVATQTSIYAQTETRLLHPHATVACQWARWAPRRVATLSTSMHAQTGTRLRMLCIHPAHPHATVACRWARCTLPPAPMRRPVKYLSSSVLNLYSYIYY